MRTWLATNAGRNSIAAALFLTLVATTLAQAGSASIKSDASALGKATARAVRSEKGFAAPEMLKLRVAGKGGTVTFTGRAGTLHDRALVARLAESVAGVSNVKSYITLGGEGVDTAAVRNAIIAAVGETGSAKSGFDALVKADGSVRLTGPVVDEWAVVAAVRKVRGVKLIIGYTVDTDTESGLRVEAPGTENDASVVTRVNAALNAQGITGISVASLHQTVTLSGNTSLGDAMTAENVARHVPGVLSVKNRMKIPGRMYRVGEAPADDDLDQAVRRALRRLRLSNGTRIDSTRVHVSVRSGRVFLSGRTDSASETDSIVAAVMNVAGVQEVMSSVVSPASGWAQ